MRLTLVRLSAVLPIACVLALPLAGCNRVSEDTQGKMHSALCSSSESSIANLRAGGDNARLVAAIIRDLADDPEVKSAAAAVANSTLDRKGEAFLADWLASQCR